jgi:hypothetical protein
MRKAVSLTLSEDNLLWLRGQAGQSPKGSISELLDRIVSEARSSGWTEAGTLRSVAGTIDLAEDDPNLETADSYIRTLFIQSARQPMLGKEPRPATRKNVKRPRRG